MHIVATRLETREQTPEKKAPGCPINIEEMLSRGRDVKCSVQYDVVGCYESVPAD